MSEGLLGADLAQRLEARAQGNRICSLPDGRRIDSFTGTDLGNMHAGKDEFERVHISVIIVEADVEAIHSFNDNTNMRVFN